MGISNDIKKREVIYYDVSPFAALSAAAGFNPALLQDFSAVQKVFDQNQVYNKIQTCEHNYTVLDGSHDGFCTDSENIAVWSLSKSIQNSRLLPEIITLDVTFGGLQRSPGISFGFDTKNFVWCDLLRVRWLRGNIILSDKIIEPDSAEYVYRNTVELYDRVIIDFMRLNMPGRFLKIEYILFGIIRIFGEGELENLTVSEGCDPSGRSLFINSAGFTINTKDPLAYIFMKRQPLHIKYGGEHIGTYYIDKSKRYADRRYAIEAVDKIGVLDSSGDFPGGIYSNIPLENLLTEITGGLFELEIEEDLKNIVISGWLPICRRRAALAQISVAYGVIFDTSRSNVIAVRNINNLNNSLYNIEKSRVYQSNSIESEFPCTAIELTEHNYIAGTASKELFRDNFTGERTIKFSEPVSNLSVTNGNIIDSGENYAVISSVNPNSICTLSGRPYIDNQSRIIIETGEVIEGTQERVEIIEDCYLVNKSNSREVAERLYLYYSRKNVFDGDFLLSEIDPEKIGRGVNIEGNISGQIERLTLMPGIKNIRARGIIRGE